MDFKRENKEWLIWGTGWDLKELWIPLWDIPIETRLIASLHPAPTNPIPPHFFCHSLENGNLSLKPISYHKKSKIWIFKQSFVAKICENKFCDYNWTDDNVEIFYKNFYYFIQSNEITQKNQITSKGTSSHQKAPQKVFVWDFFVRNLISCYQDFCIKYRNFWTFYYKRWGLCCKL